MYSVSFRMPSTPSGRCSPHRPELFGTVKRRIVPLTMVLGVGFLLLVSLALTAAISAVGNFLGDILPGSNAFWQIMNVVLSFAIITLLFAAIYKVLPSWAMPGFHASAGTSRMASSSAAVIIHPQVNSTFRRGRTGTAGA